MNHSEADEIMGVLMATYTREQWDPPTIAIWTGFLLDLDARDAEQGVTALIKESEFLPTIAAIRNRTKDFTRARLTADKSYQERLAIEAGYSSKETNQENLKRIREELARANVGRRVR